MIHRLDERSYKVEASGATFRCNKQHLVKSLQPSNPILFQNPSEIATQSRNEQDITALGHIPILQAPVHERKSSNIVTKKVHANFNPAHLNSNIQ